MPRGFAEAARGRVGRPRSLPALTRKVEALRTAFAAEGQRQHAADWDRAELEALIKALDALKSPFQYELERRWDIEAEAEAD